MKRIAVCGEIFSSNLGDGVIFDSIKYLLSKHNIEAVPLDLSGRSKWQPPSPLHNDNVSTGMKGLILQPLVRNSSKLRRSYSYIKWYSVSKRISESKWDNIISSCDAVIIGGGQLLTDIDFGFPPKIYEIYKIAKRLKKPLAIYGCGVDGPWSIPAQHMYKKTLEYAKYISVRDAYSREIILKNIGNKSPVEVHPDPGFIAFYAYNESIQKSENIIGFNIQPVSHFRAFVPSLKRLSEESYVNFWVRLIQGAYAEGYEPLIITNGDNNDFLQAKSVQSELFNLGIKSEVLPRATSPSQLIQQLSPIPILVSTRMHAGIIAYSLGSKVFAISWDKKVKNVWSTIASSYNVVDAEVLLKKDPWEYFKALMKDNVRDDKKLISIDRCIQSSINECLTSLGFGVL